jgi:hypothetical protein
LNLNSGSDSIPAVELPTEAQAGLVVAELVALALSSDHEDRELATTDTSAAAIPNR